MSIHHNEAVAGASAEAEAEAGPSRLPQPSESSTSTPVEPSSPPPTSPVKLSRSKLKAALRAERKAAKKAENNNEASTSSSAGGRKQRVKPTPVAVRPFDDPGKEEERTVHEVYEAIAPHFSQTRQKDFAISVAAIHHLSTHERRRHAVQALLKPLRLSCQPPYARFMIYVWAYEQGEASKRKMGTAAAASAAASAGGTGSVPSAPTSSLTDVSTSVSQLTMLDGDQERTGSGSDGRPTAESDEAQGQAVPAKVQDVLVPWILQNTTTPSTSPTTISDTSTKQDIAVAEAGAGAVQNQVYHRYYHLFLEGELRSLVEEAAIESGFVIRPSHQNADGEAEGKGGDAGDAEDNEDEEKRSGPWLRVKAVGWEMDNWWLEGEVGGCSPPSA